MLSSDASQEWKRWSVQDWNRAFFEHYFSYDGGGTARPIETINLAGSVWREIAGSPDADPACIREAFLETIRRNPKQFREACSTDRLDENDEWTGDEIPPFVADLIFTCLVATKPQAKGKTETNFRERVRLFMEHPEGTYYQFDELSSLWEALSRWLTRKRKEGWPYRRLELPDRGGQNRIGYSTKLAVPEWRDQRRLSRVLEGEEIDTPRVRQVLVAVAESNRSFSDRFRSLYKDFREEYLEGRTAWSDHPFWTAVERAATLTWDTRSDEIRESDTRVTYESSSSSPFGTLNLYLLDEADEIGKEVHIRKRAISVDTEWYLVQFDEGSNLSKNESLAPEDLADMAGEFAPRVLKSGVRDGVLLFARNEHGIRELRGVRPQPETKAWALVQNELIDAFLKLFEEDVEARQSAFKKWVFAGPFQFCNVIPHKSWPRELADVVALHPRGGGASIHLKGGVRVPGGFVGAQNFLPVVSVSGADEVALKGPSKAEESKEEKLIATTDLEDEQVFKFPESLAPLEGKYSILARSKETLLAQREVSFRAETVATDFKRPSNKQDWLVEGSLADTIVLEELDRYGYPPVRGTSGTRKSKPIRKPCGLSPSRVSDGSVKTSTGYDPEAVTKAINVVGAIGNRRQGMREKEFLELVADVFSNVDYKLGWEIVRAWEEVGYVDRLVKKSWNTVKYFPRQPKLIYREERGEIIATLAGLAPFPLRRQLRNLATELNVQEKTVKHKSAYVAPLLSWRLGDMETVREMTGRADLAPPRKLRSLEKVTGAMSQVLNADRGEEPLHYVHRGTWAWKLGEFRPEATNNCGFEINVQWYQRKDSPDYFRILNQGELIWWTYSRNWALLVAHALQDKQPFQFRGKWLVRTGDAQVYLPVPLARWLSIHSRHPSGPVKVSSTEDYGYRFSSAKMVTRLVSLLWGGHSKSLKRQLKWLLRQAERSRPGADSRNVRIPSDISQKIRKSNWDISLAGRREIPVHLVPHLRKLTRKL